MQSSIKNHFLSLEKPTVLKDTLLNEPWKSIACDWNMLLQQCSSILLDFRIVAKSKEGPVWENESKKVKASIADFINWISLKSPPSNPFAPYSIKENWVYSGYNYTGLKFPEDNEFRKCLDWSVFGVNDPLDEYSSVWIGSKDAYTPCHVDTYGFNLVVQIIGRKQWILFPPSDTDFMYPTRIPYEESSIFSSVDILNPKLGQYPLFQNSHPHIVTLKPGDVLFVPAKWWHFVRCLDHSVSVNRWIDVESDDESRLKEAIVKIMFAAFSDVCSPLERNNWIISNEEWTPFKDSVTLVKQAMQQIAVKNNMRSVADKLHNDEPSECTSPKIRKFQRDTAIYNDSELNLFRNTRTVPSVEFSDFVKEYCDEEIMANPEAENQNQDISSLGLSSLVNCFLHPNVISCIAKQVKCLKK